MGVDDEHVRVAVYRSFATTGAALSTKALADRLDTDATVVRERLRRLAAARHVVLDDDRIVMAHPFSAVPLGFAVMGTSTLWWGGCAWDSFAIPHLLDTEPDVLVATRCPGCDAPHAWVVRRREPPPGEQIAALPRAGRPDVGRRRAHLRSSTDLLPRSARRRVARTDVVRPGLRHGRPDPLASGWYAGRLDPGYSRREPAEAAAYLREVGLEGPFWGL